MKPWLGLCGQAHCFHDVLIDFWKKFTRRRDFEFSKNDAILLESLISLIKFSSPISKPKGSNWTLQQKVRPLSSSGLLSVQSCRCLWRWRSELLWLALLLGLILRPDVKPLNFHKLRLALRLSSFCRPVSWFKFFWIIKIPASLRFPLACFLKKEKIWKFQNKCVKCFRSATEWPLCPAHLHAHLNTPTSRLWRTWTPVI